MVQEACFRYYWEAAHPNAGMAIEILPGDKNLVALGSSGFGIMAIVVGVEREFITRKQGVERLRARVSQVTIYFVAARHERLAFRILATTPTLRSATSEILYSIEVPKTEATSALVSL